MLASVLGTAIIANAAAEPTFVNPVAVDASMFKNGYSLVTYRFDLPASGEIYIKEPPQGSFGTVWIYGEKNTKIDSVIMTRVQEEKKNTVTVNSLVEVIMVNKGKVADLAIQTPGGKVETVTAKIIDANPQIAVIQPEGSSKTQVIPARSIAAIELENAIYTKTTTSKKEIPALRIDASPNGKVYMFALQQGLGWTPAYSVDISDDKKLTITAKSTVSNQLVDLNIKEARFIAGFPNIKFLGQPDPLTLIANLGSMANNQVARGGGFGGAGISNQRAYAPSESAAADMAGSFSTTTLAGFQAEDMYFYQRPNLKLKKGENGYFLLFQAESEYSHLYTLDIPRGSQSNRQFAPTPPERTNAWHKLKFKNTTDRPLTTAPAIIMKNGEMLGQDMISYTPNTAEILLPITQSLDIASIVSEEETNRERGAITRNNSAKTPLFDKVTIQGKVAITNFKDRTVTMRITKDIYGDAINANHDNKITKLPSRTSDVNGSSKITWNINLKKGEKKTLNYTYTLLVQTRG